MWQPNTSLAWSCMNSLWGRARRIDSAPDATMGILEILSARWSASFSNQEQNITMTQTSRQLGLHWSTDTSYLSNRHSWNSIMYFGQRIHQILGQIVMIVDDWLLLVLSLFCIARDLKARSFDCSPWQRNCSFWWAVSVQYLLLGTFLSERKIYQLQLHFADGLLPTAQPCNSFRLTWGAWWSCEWKRVSSAQWSNWSICWSPMQIRSTSMRTKMIRLGTRVFEPCFCSSFEVSLRTSYSDCDKQSLRSTQMLARAKSSMAHCLVVWQQDHCQELQTELLLQL